MIERPMPRTRVLLWHPETGEHYQFTTARQFFRWAIDHLPRDVEFPDVWFVDEANRHVTLARAVWTGPLNAHDPTGRWVLEGRSERGAGRILLQGEPEDLATPRQRWIATAFELELADAFGDAVTVRFLDDDAWATLPPAVHDAYGYSIPVEDSDGNVGFLCSPAVIDAQTAHLDDELVDGYISAVAIRLLHEFNMARQGRSDDDVVRHVDRFMEEALPDQWQILQGVEAAVTDAAARALLEGLR
jgi:hypothetical protein